MLRLNMGVPPTEQPRRIGALIGDFAGFPNGRRLIDDVVDIELRAIADGYGSVLQQAVTKTCEEDAVRAGRSRGGAR